ncbi:HlyD family type I secretion periplasmic adaptor subunit [Falsirhodobacter xinxiangensis]|uniref:HlyD family type I secretion periplasmic adaptor subunit n=1 Tax=Falsirhodobacter xinxiangensis TaxID=2530049 RepID=UPI0010AAE95B|nr:HlyD family type I secretion periplasmic adaptor subunit [Rhodobacter xinxiangensis]
MNWSARGPLLLGGITLALLVGGFGVWASATHIAGAIVAPGQIQVQQNRQIVQHPDGGVVEQIAVIEGQSVQAGDLLVALDGSDLQSELAIVEGQLFELQARRGRLEAERDEAEVQFLPDLELIAETRPEVRELMDGQVKLFESRRATLAQQVDQLGRRVDQTRSQIDGIDAQKAALAIQLTLIQQELAAQQGLFERGLAEVSRVLALQREQARLSGEVGSLTASRAEAETRITETEIEILRLGSARREEAITQLRDFAYQELELAERRRALKQKLTRLEIRAPVSGIVLNLAVTTPRAVLRAADPVLYLIPQDRPLVITSQIPTIHVDEVHPGQAVRLVFSAFPSRTTPELDGHVVFVSADALTDEQTGQSYYRAEIVPNEGEVEKLTDLVLIPGMPVESFIQTGQRTPIAYLVKPLSDYFARAMRES